MDATVKKIMDLSIFKLGSGALVNFTHIFTHSILAQQETLCRIAML
jgi:hypothetical protein